MKIHTVGDQARAFVLQSQTTHLRSTLQVLTGELSDGLVADKASRLSGNMTQLHHFETQISLLRQYKSAGEEAAAIAQATQHVLGSLYSESDSYSASALGAEPASGPNSVRQWADEARSLLTSAVTRLNTEFAGLHLFSGLNVDTPPVAGAATMIDELDSLIAGMTTVDDIKNAIDTWFDAPSGGGGYLDQIYSGTIGQPRRSQIAADRTISFATDGSSPVVRALLKSLSIAVMAGSSAISLDDAERLNLVQGAARSMRSNGAEMLSEMGRIGLLEALADRFSAEHSNAMAVAEIGRSKLVSADPFETATALQEVKTQMETLYALTARLSGLKLVDYLR